MRHRGLQQARVALILGPLAAVVWISTPRAIAQPAPVDDSPEVVYAAPPQCGDRAVFEGHLRRFLARDAGPLALGVAVSAVVERRPAHGYVLVLEIHGANLEATRREVQHPSRCTVLVEIAALIVAMAVDPDAAIEFGPDLLSTRGLVVTSRDYTSHATSNHALIPNTLFESMPASHDSSVQLRGPLGPEPESVEPWAPLATSESSSEHRFGAGLGVAGGLVGGVAPGFTIGATRLRLRRRFDLLASFDGSHQRTLVEGNAASARLRAWTLSFAGCFHRRIQRIELDACGRVDVGVTRASASDVIAASSAARAHVRVAAEPRVTFRVRDNGFVGLRAFVSYAAYQPRFGVAPVGTLELVSRFGAGAVAYGEWRWN